jgi:hypothetical protein
MKNEPDVILEKDYKDLISIFLEDKVKFLLVGGYAVGKSQRKAPRFGRCGIFGKNFRAKFAVTSTYEGFANTQAIVSFPLFLKSRFL